MKEFLKNRDHDLLVSARRLIDGREAGTPIRIHDLAVAAINTTAPHYYLTFDYAYRHLRRYRRDSSLFGGDSLRAVQMREIISKVDAMKARADTITDHVALMRVLADSRASRFFLSEAYAVKLIRKLLYKRQTKQ